MSKVIRNAGLATVLACSLLVGNFAFAQSTIVAKVGEMEITDQELTIAESDLKEQFAQVPEEKRRSAILAALIDIKLLANKASSAGMSDEELYKSQMAFVSARALHNLYFQKNIVETITDEEVKERFEKELAAMPVEKEIKARHILLKTEEEALAVVAELDGGKDFIEVAKEKSTGPSGPNGGDLGFFGKDQMVPEFQDAAFALENGQYTKTPVKTQFGYHVILKEEERDKPLPVLTDVQDQIRQVVLREKYFELIQATRKEIPIEIFDEALKADVDAMNK